MLAAAGVAAALFYWLREVPAMPVPTAPPKPLDGSEQQTSIFVR